KTTKDTTKDTKATNLTNLTNLTSLTNLTKQHDLLAVRGRRTIAGSDFARNGSVAARSEMTPPTAPAAPPADISYQSAITAPSGGDTDSAQLIERRRLLPGGFCGVANNRRGAAPCLDRTALSRAR